jgi:GT2 family glycosyltransferase
MMSDLPSLPENIQSLEDEAVEPSLLFRFLQYAGRVAETQKKKAGQLLLHSPFHPLYLRTFGRRRARAMELEYTQWLSTEESRWPSRQGHQKVAAGWPFQPTLSILVPTFQPRKEWLEQAIASVKAQSYEKWQLCICDDASSESWVREYLQIQAAADPRIRVTFRESNGGIASALNGAGELAVGEYVTFLDHDDMLHPFALHYVVEACQEDSVDVLYSDEDYLNPSGERSGPTFKPDWSPELLTACMYFGHLLVARRGLVEEAGWFRSAYDGAQDYDLALRLVESARKVRHIRRLLYHWRQHPQSTSMNVTAKPYAHDAGRRAVSDTVARREIPGVVENGPIPYTYYIRRPAKPEPVSLVVCSRNAKRLSAFLEAQKRTLYPHVVLVVVEHITGKGRPLASLLEGTACIRVPYEGAFNFSLMNNLGAQAAGSELLVFINDDVTPLRPDWLEVMAAQLLRPEIGAMGGRLLYPSGAIQHAGLVLGLQDGVGHPGRGSYRADLMYYLQLPRDVSAVTGACLGIRRSVFQEVGGFDLTFPVNYNDVDLCLKIMNRGYRVVVDPHIELTHLECGTRRGGTAFAERQRFQERWGGLLRKGDPYYPDAFTRTEEVRLAVR